MLREALLSVQAQTYGELEILVQDDSTSDECRQVVKSFNDSRIRYSRNEPPLGTSLNLLAGYRSSRGKYFCTLNDDDLYAPTYITTLIQAMEGNANYSIAFSDSYLIDSDGKLNQEETDANTRSSLRGRLREGSVPSPLEVGILYKSIPGMLALFRRDAVDLDDFPEEVSSGYDYWLTYLALRDGNPIYYSPERLTFYRIHEGSQTSSFAHPEQRLRFLKYSQYIHGRFLADSRLKSIHSALRPRLAQSHSSSGFSWLRLRSRKKALSEFINSYRAKPSRAAMIGFTMCLAPRAVVDLILRRRG